MKIIPLASYFLLMCCSLAAGADHRVARDPDGLTPLHLAAGRGDLVEVKRQLSRGGDLFALDSKMGVSVLHKAVYSGKAEVVDFLLSRGALIDLQSPSNGNTPLHDAIYFKSGNDLSVIRALIKHKPSLSIRNRAGLAPLESARVLKDDSVVRLLEEFEKSNFSPEGRALMVAVKANDLSKVSELLSDQKAPLKEADEQGFTPLIWAARQGYDSIILALLKRGANPNANDQWMRANAGHKAAFWGRAGAMKLLVEHGLQVDARGGYNGYTALHDAVARGHLDVVRVLLEKGARTDIKGHDGKTPIDLARAGGNQECLGLLQGRNGAGKR